MGDVEKMSNIYVLGISGDPRNRRDQGTPENIEKNKNVSKMHLQVYFWMFFPLDTEPKGGGGRRPPLSFGRGRLPRLYLVKKHPKVNLEVHF